MLDIADRDTFLAWLENHHEDLVDQVSQRPRSIRDWANDYARALRSATAEMGMDPGHAGVFGEPEDEMGLHDPDAEDEVW
jgi:hypothetical protein